MIEKLTEWLMKWCEKRGRVIKITGTAGPDDVYLIRYYLVRSDFLNIYIHQFLRSDRDDLHDHPWDFFTYLVRGAYTENKWNPKTNKVDSIIRGNYKVPFFKDKMQYNTLVFRKATDQHQVVVNRDLKEKDKAKAALTICVTGPTRREWGFIKEKEVQASCPDGQPGCAVYHLKKIRKWVDWRTYLGLPPDAPRR